MTQREYLEELEQQIELLDEEIAEDILEYYRNRFIEEKRYENKSEDKIIKELGKPIDLAHRIYTSYGIKKELWQSAREEEVNLRKAIPVLAFDVLIASWVIPVLIFLVLAGFATFITFPFVIAALPGLVFSDAFLMVLFAIGSYSLLLLLIIGIGELAVIVIKNILIMNFKVLTPQNKTTTRMLKRFSLFSWMRTIKMGRNIFINLGMVGLTLVSTSFILLVNSGTDFNNIFGTTQKLSSGYEEDMLTEVANRDAYNISLTVGDMDIILNRNSSNYMTIDHTYNYEDYFFYEVDTETNTIFISTIPDKIREGVFTPYEGSLSLSLPSDLIIQSMNVSMGDGDINMTEFKLNDFDLTLSDGDIVMYDIDAIDLDITAAVSDITILDSFIDDVSITNHRGYVALKNINNMLNDGYIADINVPYGRVNLSNTYFRDFIVDTFTADVYLNNNNDLYSVSSININTVEGEVFVQDNYKNLLDQE